MENVLGGSRPRSESPASSPASASFNLAPIRAEVDQLQRITVCTRPFRAQGPRIEPERIGDKLIVHNYGHGGSGWSLSWGSAAIVVSLALADNPREVAVIGCGALGLTSAISLQRAGARVVLYARDTPPNVRSSRATGLWSPDSRVALASATNSSFATRWEQMARFSWATFGQALGQPGTAIDMHARYLLSDLPPDEEILFRYREDPVGFAHLEDRLEDLYPASTDFDPGQHPFHTAHCREIGTLRFNITAYSEQLLAEFHERGGTLHTAEFHTPSDLAQLPQSVIVNCTGWGAKALFGDDTLTPVRGQIGWLPTQSEVTYSLQWEKLSIVSRLDGMVVQVGASSDGTGWNDGSEAPDRAESEAAIRLLGGVQARMQRPS